MIVAVATPARVTYAADPKLPTTIVRSRTSTIPTTTLSVSTTTLTIAKPVNPFPTVPACPTPELAVSRWPLRTRVAQLVAIGVDGRSLTAATRLVAEQHVGGLVVRTPPASASQFTTDLAALRSAEGSIPTTLSVDEEGGRVQVLRHVLGAFPSARRLAKYSPSKVRSLVSAHSNKVRALGFDMVLGPVLDVTAAKTGVVGNRSFGDDPFVVGQLGAAYASGVRDAGIVAVLKHFPGHGSVDGDSHVGRVTTLPIDLLRSRDEIPFRMALADGPAAVMIGHLEVPGLTGDTPSTLSVRAITTELRNTLGFDGLVITDSLSMGAVTSRWSAPSAAVEAVAAGADIALFVTISERDAIGVMDALEFAVSVGRIPEAQLNASVTRVVRSKNLDPCALTPSVLALETATAEAIYRSTR